jgi:hypothetical protein
MDIPPMPVKCGLDRSGGGAGTPVSSVTVLEVHMLLTLFPLADS